MNVLMVFHAAPNAPPLDMGPAKRSFPFFLEMAKRHTVSVVSYGKVEEEKRFRDGFGARCKSVEFVRPGLSKVRRILRRLMFLLTGRSLVEHLFHHAVMQKAIDRATRNDSFDLIYCSTIHLGWFQFPSGVAIVGDTHNVDFDLIYRMHLHATSRVWRALYYVEYHRCKRDELMNIRKFNRVTTTTDRDRDIFLGEVPDLRVTTIQNGVDRRFFEKQTVAVEPHTMLFLGLMSYLPNRNGVVYFLDDIFPLIQAEILDAKVYVVGANPPKVIEERASKKVIVTGFVDDVRPYIARSEVFVIPLLIGGGIRGKALEAMAMKRPIVTTHLGCEGIRLEHGSSALFADSPREFADAVVRLMRDPAVGERLAARAYDNVVESYDWTAKGEQLETVCMQALKEAHFEG